MKYRVRVLELAGKGKKVHKSQDIIDADALEDRNIDELVTKGFIAEVPEKGDKVKPPAQDPPPSDPVAEKFDDITKNELKAWLEGKEIAFNPKANKTELHQLYEDNF